jgi:hypothetical protein
MRLPALLLAVSLAGALPAAGQSAEPGRKAGAPSSADAPAAQAPSPEASAATPPPAQPSNLPVSLDRIREGLKQTPTPLLRGLDSAQLLRGFHQEAMFKVHIQERQKIEELLSTLDFKAGPTPAGGVYAHELQRIVRSPVDYPLAQPYAAFSTSELLTITIENLIFKYLGGRALNAVTAYERQRAEQAARDEVARAMADFCNAQPNRGSGLHGCQVASWSR